MRAVLGRQTLQVGPHSVLHVLPHRALQGLAYLSILARTVKSWSLICMGVLRKY